jgi:hypothetical protein
MLRQLSLATIFTFFAFLTQSLTVPQNNTTLRTDNAVSLLNNSNNSLVVNNPSPKENSLKDNQSVSKIKKNKISRYKRGFRKNKVPLFVKLGLIFLGIGLVFLLAAFWGWIFSVSLESLSSWIPLALQAGVGSVAAGLVFLIISWLAN